MHIFFIPPTDEPNYLLPEDESKHAIQVMRLQLGANVSLIDGKGGWYTAEIIDAHRKRCALKIIEKIVQPKRNFRVHIAVAPTKNNDRLEWFLEKATEIGIDEITPIICDHSERKVIKLDRLEKILVAAIKQSKQAYLPQLNDAISYQDFIPLTSEGQRFVAHCEETDKNPLKNSYQKGSDVLILIGPEGDFSEKEITLAKENGFEPISLGENRLRTETAALVACHTINLINE